MMSSPPPRAILQASWRRCYLTIFVPMSLLLVVFLVSESRNSSGLPSPTAVASTADTFSALRALSPLSIITHLGCRPAASKTIVTVATFVKDYVLDLHSEGEIQDWARISGDLEPVTEFSDELWADAPGALTATIFNSTSTVPDGIRSMRVFMGSMSVVVVVPGSDPQGSVVVSSSLSGSVFSGDASDAASLSITMELVRNLCSGPQPRHNIVFVADGAGNNQGFAGTHSFLSDHPMGQEVILGVSLSSLGSMGTFQATRSSSSASEFLRAYSKTAAHPTGSSLIQDIRSKLIWETPYLAFRNREVPAIDFGFLRGAQRYSSSSDELSYISTSSVQQAGENLLPFLRKVGSMDVKGVKPTATPAYALLGHENPKEQAFYISPMGTSMIVWWNTETVGIVVASCCGIYLFMLTALLCIRTRVRRGSLSYVLKDYLRSYFTLLFFAFLSPAIGGLLFFFVSLKSPLAFFNPFSEIAGVLTCFMRAMACLLAGHSFIGARITKAANQIAKLSESRPLSVQGHSHDDDLSALGSALGSSSRHLHMGFIVRLSSETLLTCEQHALYAGAAVTSTIAIPVALLLSPVLGLLAAGMSALMLLGRFISWGIFVTLRRKTRISTRLAETVYTALVLAFSLTTIFVVGSGVMEALFTLREITFQVSQMACFNITAMYGVAVTAFFTAALTPLFFNVYRICGTLSIFKFHMFGYLGTLLISFCVLVPSFPFSFSSPIRISIHHNTWDSALDPFTGRDVPTERQDWSFYSIDMSGAQSLGDTVLPESHKEGFTVSGVYGDAYRRVYTAGGVGDSCPALQQLSLSSTTIDDDKKKWTLTFNVNAYFADVEVLVWPGNVGQSRVTHMQSATGWVDEISAVGEYSSDLGEGEGELSTGPRDKTLYSFTVPYDQLKSAGGESAIQRFAFGFGQGFDSEKHTGTTLFMSVQMEFTIDSWTTPRVFVHQQCEIYDAAFDKFASSLPLYAARYASYAPTTRMTQVFTENQ